MYRTYYLQQYKDKQIKVSSIEKKNPWVTSYENCSYSDRLITKLVALNEKAKKKINVLEVKKAIYYAKKYHGAQKRETGEPVCHREARRK